MSLKCRKPLGTAKTWRLLFAAIFSSRALASLVREVLDGRRQTLRSLSYVAIDVAEQNSLHDHDNGDDPNFGNIDQKAIQRVVRDKSFESLRQHGGVKGIAALLQTDEKNGIQGDEAQISHRSNILGANKYKISPAKSFFGFVYEAFKTNRIMVLLVCAIFSLVIDIKQHGWKQGWCDGGSIILVVSLMIIVSSVSHFKQNRQFEKLFNEIGDTKIEVVRNGRRLDVSIIEVVVGDVVCLKIGDQVPADGLLLNGHSLTVDESSITGESDHVEIKDSSCPFLLSGTKVTGGSGFMLVTSVGMNTVRGERASAVSRDLNKQTMATGWGGTMSSISRDLNEQSTLQVSLDKLNSHIGKIGLVASLLVLLVLLIRYFPGNSEFYCNKATDYDIMIALIRINASIVTIAVVTIPEGLPLAVTLIFAYSMKHMAANNALVKKLSACEKIGSATIICTNKTGTLTLNKMKVTELWLGASTNTIPSNIARNVYKLLQEGVALNTTGTVCMSNSESPPEIHGSPTEQALLSWALLDMGINLDNPKQNCQILKRKAFDSERKRSGVLMKRISERAIHTHWKGDAEMILAMCSHYYDRSGAIRVMDDEERTEIETIVKDMAAKSLRCLAFAHTEVAKGAQIDEKLEESGLTLVGIFGLMDPCRPGVRTAVESCKKAGVNVKMITGDNVFTARAVAIECGILSPNEDLDNDAVSKGFQFRNYSDKERKERSEKISVMAGSSPCDKHLLVKCLKEEGHVVAVTGDGTSDAPALKEADIGLSMWIQGTEVANEISDLVILDGNFSSVVKVLRWARCVYNNIQKFIQLHLTVNVAALVINFTSAVSSGDISLTVVQLLWVNLIMDTLGALALATERPTNQLMNKPPVARTEPLITKIMWRNLLAQVLYQVIVLLTLKFGGTSIFGMEEKVKNTLIFNIFVLCQIFNEFNARNMEDENIFKGLRKNKLFVGIVGLTVILQAVVVEFLSRFANTERLKWEQWSACVGFAAVSWLVGWVVKLIPVHNFNLFQAWRPCNKWKSS